LESRTLLAYLLPVTTTADDGPGSLRQAILAADAIEGDASIVFHIGPDDPNFIDADSALPGGDADPDVFVITPRSPLPDLNNSRAKVLIDGDTQAIFGGDTNPFGPEIVIDGSLAGGGSGLAIGTSGNTIRGLNIRNGPGAGIAIVGGSSNVIQGDFIGTDPTGTIDQGNAGDGIQIFAGSASNNLIGGGSVGQGNLISGNGRSGIWIVGSDVHGNRVQGNIIGLSRDGSARLDNSSDGILVQDSPGNIIGGSAAGEGNVISGNDRFGVWVVGANAAQNLLQGNAIGTNADGTAALGNGSEGVLLQDGGSNTIGGTAAGAGNLISGNGSSAISMVGTAGQNLIQGNRLGTDRAGMSAIGNGLDGVTTQTADNTIGGTTSGAGNLIAGNPRYGVYLQGSGASRNVVLGNRIGTDASGVSAVANGSNGVDIEQAAGNKIGGSESGAGNLISGNNGTGVLVFGASATGNAIAGNLIGTDASGLGALGNGSGVFLNLAPGNTIGGVGAGARNVISGNRGNAISMSQATDTVIQGNYVGVAADGGSKLGNSGFGISVATGSDRAILGGTAPGAGNVVSGNSRHGVRFAVSSDGVVQGNFIGTDATGLKAIGNTGAGPLSGIGLSIENSSNILVGGTVPGARNVIAANVNGIAITGTTPAAQFNRVQGNYVGLGADGTTKLGNTSQGIAVTGPNNTIGGSTSGSGNVISGNGTNGVSILASAGNVVQGNLIGTDASGTLARGNGGSGVILRLAATSTQVGSPGAGNTIAFNGAAGVTILDASSTGNTIRANTIFSNAGLAIDLAGDGVTANDSAGNAGPNLFQDFPVITAAYTANSTTTITGTVSGPANSTLWVELFSNPVADPSGYGQGQVFLGYVTVTTGVGGGGSFTFTTSSTVPVGQVVSATATDVNGDTSEFAQDVTVSDHAPLNIGYQITGPVYNPIKKTYTETVTLTNDGATTVNGFEFVLEGLTPGVTLTNKSGTTSDGSPYLTVTASLMPGQSTTVTLIFTKSSPSLFINYTPEFVPLSLSPSTAIAAKQVRGPIDAIPQPAPPVIVVAGILPLEPDPGPDGDGRPERHL
jgi:titin